MKYPDETFLARWMAGELSPEELAAFEQTEDYQQLSKFMKLMEQGEAQPFDQEKVLQKVKAAIREEVEVPKTNPLWQKPAFYLSMAAAVMVLLLVFWPESEPQTFIVAQETQKGEQKVVQLKDGSTVTLNAESILAGALLADFSARKLRLAGEAFFEVPQKGAFQVETALGKVSVLGTSFSVSARQQHFLVQCYSGKVEVLQAGSPAPVILEPGDQFEARGPQATLSTSFELTQPRPTWTTGASQLNQVPLAEIAAELGRQFDVRVLLAPELDPQKILTVSFPHDQLEAALQIGFQELGIAWEQQGDSLVILKAP
ncbi:MAG: FecR domain-containing protein [Bacteroidota bacterium]